MARIVQWLRRRGLASRRLSMAGHVLGLGTLALSFAPGAQGIPSPPPAYRIIDLGKLGLEGEPSINTLGQVAGNHTVGGHAYAAIYDNAGLHDLGGLGGIYSQASAINDLGQVVGVAATPPATNPIFNGAWTNHAFLSDGAGMHDLGTLGGIEAFANAINNAGQVVGTSTVGGGTLLNYQQGSIRAFLYQNGVMTGLGLPPDLPFPDDTGTSITASAINASGQVLVMADRSGEPQRIYLWQNGVWQYLSALDGALVSPRALSDAGVIVGELPNPGSGPAFLYDSAGLHDLGTLGGPGSQATALNNLGQIVGRAQIVAPPPAHPLLYENGVVDHPFLYSGGVMYDLTNLLLASAPWEQFTPEAINDRGAIVGTASWGGGSEGNWTIRTEPFLLEPDATAQVTVPQAPSGAAVAFVSLRELDLTWTDNSDNEQSFEIQRRQSWSEWTTLGSVPPNTTTYADTSVEPYTHYLYRVRAVDGAGASDWSGEAAGDSGSGAVAALGWSAQDFGAVPLGTSSDPISLTITNRGTAPLTLPPPMLAGSDAGDFAIVDSPTTLAPGDTGAIHLRFTPAALGSRSAQLILPSNATNLVEPIGLTGSGAPPPVPTLGVSAAALDFGRQPMGLGSSLALVLQNTGPTPLQVGSIAVLGLDAADFELATDNCSGGSLPPGHVCLLNIRFTPAATGSRSASLVIPSDAAGSPQLVPLTGVGTAPLLTLSAESLLFSLQPVGAAQTLTLTNSGDAPLAIASVAVEGADAGHFPILSDTGEQTLDPGASRTLRIAFNPAAGATVARARRRARIAAAGYNATLVIRDNDPHPGPPHQVALAAVAIAPAAGSPGDTTPPPPPFGVAPAAPTGLTAIAAPSAQVSLAWASHSDNETAFAIWRQGGGHDWARIGVVAPGTTHFLDTSAAPDTGYTYRVRATNNSGASDWSNTVSLTTVTPPAAPTDLAAGVDTETQVTLTWSRHSNNEYAFAIWRLGGGSGWERMGVVPPGTTTYTDRSLAPGASYTYRVRATNLYASGWSNEVTVTLVTPPAAPTDLAAVAGPSGAVTLTWTSHSDNELAFAIWRLGGGHDWARIGVVSPKTTRYTDTTAQRGVSYSYRVRATNRYASDWTNTVSVTAGG